MFDIYDIEWEGNQHRGIDDARNTSKLIFRFRDSLRPIFKFSQIIKWGPDGPNTARVSIDTTTIGNTHPTL